MAVIAEVTLRGITQEQYDVVRERVGHLERPPDGLIAHMTWWDGEGTHNLDGWESEAAFDAFARERLGPVMAALGIDVMPEVTFHPAHEIYSPRAGVVAATETPNIAAAPDVDGQTAEAEALLRRMFDEIINQGHLEVVDELFADDYVDHGPMGDMAGREAFKQLVAQWRDAVPDVHCEVDTVVRRGDLCAWLVRTTGTHTGGGLGFPATGRRFETVSANVGRLRDGRAAEHWAEQGMFPMLVQLGVLPAPAAVPSPRTAQAGAAVRT
jgi:predicted SnoaL-like aldol condensation-catalyzing enzyme